MQTSKTNVCFLLNFNEDIKEDPTSTGDALSFCMKQLSCFVSSAWYHFQCSFTLCHVGCCLQFVMHSPPGHILWAWDQQLFSPFERPLRKRRKAYGVALGSDPYPDFKVWWGKRHFQGGKIFCFHCERIFLGTTQSGPECPPVATTSLPWVTVKTSQAPSNVQR